MAERGTSKSWNAVALPLASCTTWEAVLKAIDDGLKPFKKLPKREVTEDDLVRLTEIKIKRISKFDSFKADEEIKALENDIEETEKNLKQLTRYTIRWFEELKKKYGKGREWKTEITTFDRVDRTQVILATETLYSLEENLLLYFTLGLVITAAMQFAGVLLVFNFLVLPAVTGLLLARTMRGTFTVALVVSLLAVVAGFALSVPFDLPSAPAMIAVSGLLTLTARVARKRRG